MGLYIKGAKMPKNCWVCPCYNKEYLICQVTESCCEYEKPDNCPLVELPSKHGRLVDCDKLVEKEEKKYLEQGKELPPTGVERLVLGLVHVAVMDVISEDNAPTVLKAE